MKFNLICTFLIALVSVAPSRAAKMPEKLAEMKTERKQYIAGINNLSYWKGETTESTRNHIFHYYESKLMAVRMGELMAKHLMTLGEYPPVQGGKSFNMSNVVQKFINKAKQ